MAGATPATRSRRITRIGEMFFKPKRGGSANASRQMKPVIKPMKSGLGPGIGNVTGRKPPIARTMPRWTMAPSTIPRKAPTIPITNNTPM